MLRGNLLEKVNLSWILEDGSALELEVLSGGTTGAGTDGLGASSLRCSGEHFQDPSQAGVPGQTPHPL